MLPNLDLERRIQALERNMREIRGDRGATEPATWTPTWTGLTVVGSPTYTGRYTRTGNIVKWQAVIVAGGAITTQSVAGITFINNLPFISAAGDTLTAADATNVLGIGIGFINGGTDDAYTPAWGPTNDTIVISGWYEI